MDNKDTKMEQKIYGQNKNGKIVCLGVRLSDGGVGEMPMRGSRINRQALVGEKVVFYNKNKDKHYDIEVVDYIYEKNKDKKFIVKYQDESEKEIRCGNFIKDCYIEDMVKEKLNTFRKVDNYYIMTIETKGTKAETDFNGESVGILFDGVEEVVKGIINSNWYLNKAGKSESTYYIQTSNFNKSRKKIKLHQAVFNRPIPKGMVINHINRAKGSWKDNRLSNLEIASKKQNARNLSGAGFPTKVMNYGWNYQISINGFKIQTPTRKSYNEADLDALTIQEHFNYTHRKDEWCKTKNINQEYKSNLIGLMEKKLEKVRSKGYKITKNEFETIEIGGAEVVKVYGIEGKYCFIDKEDLWVLKKGKISQNNQGYWILRINNKKYGLHRFILGIVKTNEFHHLQVDHINQNPSDNRKENLRITTEAGNKANKKGVGIKFYSHSGYYRVHYKSYHSNLKQHSQISNSANPNFKTKFEAKEEVYKRKYLVNYIRPQFKNLDEYLIFEEEYNTHKKDEQTLDDYWITTRFPNINEIEIPKFSEENMDKL